MASERISGFGTVDGVPWLPEGFDRIFRSTREPARGIHLHTVMGGDGPPLLLVAGWPQTWYAWRFVMLELAQRFTVVAVDPRGVGRSDKPYEGYDIGTLAADYVALMHGLGHDRFAMIGHDIGLWTGYALAIDHPEVLDRIAMVDAVVPGLTELPSIIGTDAQNDQLWHFSFNRKRGINEWLVRGREQLFYGYLFAAKAVVPLAPEAVEHYAQTLARDPDALRASFEFYRVTSENIAQNERRRQTQLRLPVLTVAGAGGQAERVGRMLDPLAREVRSIVLPDCGHYVPEERPGELLLLLLDFLEPYRIGAERARSAP